MRHAVKDLEGALLDAAVARAEGMTQMEGGWYSKDGVFCSAENWRPSRSWAWGGPIIERERITLLPWSTAPLERPASRGRIVWTAHVGGDDCSRAEGYAEFSGPDGAKSAARTPLIAAMRAYVASRFGEFVELP